MRVDPQRRGRTCVSEPVRNLRDRYSGGNQLRSMSVSQAVKRDTEAKLDEDIVPCRTEGVGVPWALGAGRGKHECVARKLAEAERKTQLKLLTTVIAQCLDDDIGQTDHSLSAFCLRPLE